MYISHDIIHLSMLGSFESLSFGGKENGKEAFCRELIISSK
jgi:hypothetical protein